MLVVPIHALWSKRTRESKGENEREKRQANAKTNGHTDERPLVHVGSAHVH